MPVFRLFITAALLKGANGVIEVRHLRYEPAELRALVIAPTLAIGLGRSPLGPAEDWIAAFSGNLTLASGALARTDRWHLLTLRENALEIVPPPGDAPSSDAAMAVWWREAGVARRAADTPLLWVASAAFAALPGAVFEPLLHRRAGRPIRPPAGALAHPGTETSNRAHLNAARRVLLEQLTVLTSEGIAERRGSITRNASQLAADLREQGRIFGVRYGKTYYYPEFQFDDRGRIRAAAARVRAALGTDPQGWDTLRWFSAPNAALDGERPAALIATEPERVEAAARQARRVATAIDTG